MKIVIIISLFLIASNATDLDSTQCTCDQLKNQSDCLLNPNCQWNSSLFACQVLISNTVIPQPSQGVRYCTSFSETLCPKKRSCAWLNGTCTHFTGCSAYLSSTDTQCQSISERCFKSDGQRCVEIGDCKSYTLQTTCTHSKGQETNSGFCYWDTTGSQPICVDAKECSQLPISLQNDSECRKEISTCRFKQGGGCETSPKECSDHQNENQCFWDFGQTLKCFWTSNKCLTKNCDNAPLTYLTDEACKQFLPECTTKQDGGCTIRSTCSKATVQAACVKNLDGDNCYWNGIECNNLECNTAPKSMISNSDCENFKSGCITKSGGGCLQNTKCAVADIEIACSKDINGFECIWNNTCKEKTCDNAPSTLTTHEACQQYLTTCTVNVNGLGCQDKQCGNAPMSLTTTEQCEQYLPKKKCITNLNGGCITNTTCDKIGIEVSCLKDASDRVCFWNDGKCLLKTCQNAPASMNTHQLCQEYQVICTVNETSNGCVDMTCPNLLSESICQNDLNGFPCKWIGTCYMKQCRYAPDSNNTHELCHSYLSTCTVNPSLVGCQEIPQNCESLSIEANCKINKANQLCGWTGTTCMIKNCLTAPKTYTMNYECESYVTGCVVNNEAKGCMSLPTTCNGRGQQQNCEVGSSPKCFWSQINNQCIDRTCTTALSGSNCTTYDANTLCINNATNTGCIEKPTTCTGLAQTQCLPSAKIGGDCYWQTTSSSCVDFICSNLKPSTIDHDNCNSLLSKCTVNTLNNGCVDKSEKCSDYTAEQQCKFSSLNERCKWTVSGCKTSTCDDAPTTSLYNDHIKCTGWSNKCTVGLDIGDGCIERSNTCTGLSESKCTYTNTLQRCMWNGAECVFLSSITQCESLKMSSAYTDSSCGDLMSKCEANSSGNGCVEINRICADYCGSFSFESCQEWKNTCSLNKAKTTCVEIKSLCSGYLEGDCYRAREGQCIWTNTCNLLNNSIQCSSLVLVTYSIVNCSNILEKCTTNNADTGCIDKTCQNFGGTTFSRQNCHNWISTCTVNRLHTACIIKESSCSNYSVDNCYEDNQGYCIMEANQCKQLDSRVCNEIVAINQVNTDFCQGLNQDCYIDSTDLTCELNKIENICKNYPGTIFNYTYCMAWFPDCTANVDETACIPKTCASAPYRPSILNSSICEYWIYYSENYCASDLSQTKCFAIKETCQENEETECFASLQQIRCRWQDGACVSTNAITCDEIQVPSVGFSDFYCYQQSSVGLCSVNYEETACFLKSFSYTLSCSELTKSTCLPKKNFVCIWKEGTGCVELTDCSEIVRPSGRLFTNEFCRSRGPCSSSDDQMSCIPYNSCQTLDLAIYTKSTCGLFLGTLCTANSSGTKCITATKCQEYYLEDYSQCQTKHAECTHLFGDGCVPYNNTCDLYTEEGDCHISKAGLCYWSTTCLAISTTDQCALVVNTIYSQQFCNSLTQIQNTGCNVNRNKTKCIKKPSSTCESITVEDDCAYSNSGQPCNWSGSACVTSNGCNGYIPKLFTKENCIQFDFTTEFCHVNSDNTACMAVTCADYKGPITAPNCRSWSKLCTANRIYNSCVTAPSACSSGTAENCVKDSNNIKCLWNGSACSNLGYSQLTGIINGQQCTDLSNELISYSKCKDKVCSDYSGTVTQANCQNFLATCVSKRDGSACLPQENLCSTYTETQCFYATEGICNWTGSACELITSTTTCASLKPATFTDATCSLLKLGCFANSNSTACEVKACTAKPSGSNLTFQDCQDWSPACSVNAAKTGCVDLKATCNLYTSASDCNYATEGECWQSSSGCAIKTCASQTTLTTDLQCSSFLSKCTIGIQGLCIPRKACNLYSSQTQCFKNDLNKDCYWMTHVSIQRCDDMTCTNFPTTSPYNSHSGCQTALNTCTVAASGSGCVSKGECTIYTVQAQCITSLSGDDCVWNSDLSTKCQLKSCITASHSITTHSDCYNYLTTGLRCTLNSTAKGCQSLASCSTYTQVQCIMDLDGNNCAWNVDKCEIKTCLTASADESHNDHSKCNSYLNNCTVAASGLGCIPIPAQCSEMTLEDQCRTTSNSVLCYWNTEITSPLCQTRTCSNAPSTANNGSKCNAHMIGCTLDDIKCKPKSCEDIPYTTDEQCKAALPECTTNGTICQLRGACSQATNQAGCISDNTGKQCEWVNQSSRCALKSCETAPIAYASEQECQSYITGCTAQLGGGCTKKGSCPEAKVQAACTKGIDGALCSWSNGTCKVQECSDLYSTTHQGCFAQKSTCTTNGSGQCTNMTLCSLTQVEQACIEGTDGPCLWVDGACYQYDHCESLKWVNDTQCKKISSNCTTNGSQCFPITDCSKTNTQGGCVSGTDGKCAQNQLESMEQPVCLKFSSCTDLYYKTHQECNDVNSSCTSDMEKGCIVLLKCEQYTLQGNCYLSVDDNVKNELNQITQTKNCIWDDTVTPNVCRNSKCTDLVGTTDQECKEQLSQCTSNGMKCIVKSTCQEYKEESQCSIGTGSDGICFWNTEKLSCRLKVCSDFINGTCSVVQNCIPNYDVDENTCTLKTTCSAYKTIKACREGGNDGMCVWDSTGNKCSKMTSCSSANDDETSCLKMSKKCLWTGNQTTSNGSYIKSSCQNLQCSLLSNSNCGSFSNWENVTLTSCVLKEGICREVLPETLKSSQCYLNSEKQYSWNDSSQRCEICNIQTSKLNNNNAKTKHIYLLGLSLIAGILLC